MINGIKSVLPAAVAGLGVAAVFVVGKDAIAELKEKEVFLKIQQVASYALDSSREFLSKLPFNLEDKVEILSKESLIIGAGLIVIGALIYKCCSKKKHVAINAATTKNSDNPPRTRSSRSSTSSSDGSQKRLTRISSSGLNLHETRV